MSRAMCKREVDAGHEVAVVVSAMSGKTNELVAWVNEAAPLYDAAEYDAVVASGELVTAGLLAIVLKSMGLDARSWQGWQIPLITDDAHGSARIAGIDGSGVVEGFARGQVAVVAGFQGVHAETNRVTTLGRGGSDTSAVALAAALQGRPLRHLHRRRRRLHHRPARRAASARRLDKVSFEEMLEMASLGAKVLQVRSVEVAMVHKVQDLCALLVRRPRRSQARHADLRRGGYRGAVRSSPASPSRATRRRSPCARSPTSPASPPRSSARWPTRSINVDMIIQVVSDDAKHTDITFTVPTAEYKRAMAILEAAAADIGYGALHGAQDVVKVSAIGVGMRSHHGVAARAFKALAEKGINIRAITTSEIKFSVLIDEAYLELAVRTLHTLYGLDKAAD